MHPTLRPPSPAASLKSRFPKHDAGFGIFSNSNRITFHNQTCLMWTGDVKLLDLKGYLKDGKQYGKTLGKRPAHFVKVRGIWHRVK